MGLAINNDIMMRILVDNENDNDNGTDNDDDKEKKREKENIIRITGVLGSGKGLQLYQRMNIGFCIFYEM
jgi:hypothetical protein